MPNIADLFGGSNNGPGLSTEYGTGNYNPAASLTQNTRPMSSPDVLPYSTQTNNTRNSQFAFRSAQMGTATLTDTGGKDLEIPSSLRMGSEE